MTLTRLSQLQQCKSGTKYIVVSRNYDTRHWVVKCVTEERLRELWNSLAPDQRETTNFTFEQGTLQYSNTVLIPESSNELNEFSLEFDENRGTIWDFIALLFKHNAQVLIEEGVTAPISCTRFSYSTPSITIGAYTPNGYKSICIWSYSPLQARPMTTFRVTSSAFEEIKASGFASDIVDPVVNQNDGCVEFGFPVRKLPSAYSDEVNTLLSVCPALICEHIVRADLGQTMLDGLTSAYKYLRNMNGITFPASPGYVSNHDQRFDKNVEVIRKYARPTASAFSRKVFNKETTYYADKIKATDPNLFEDLFRTFIFNDPDPKFLELFTYGFNLIYNPEGIIPDTEYHQYTEQIRSLIFSESLQWFKYKIAILEFDITSAVCIPYNVVGGTIEFKYTMSLAWGFNSGV